MSIYMHDRVYISSEGRIIGYNISLCKQLKSGKFVPLTQHQCAISKKLYKDIKNKIELIDKDKVEIVESFKEDNLIYAYDSGITEESMIGYQIVSDLTSDDFLYNKSKDLYFLKSFGIKTINSFEDFLKVMSVES